MADTKPPQRNTSRTLAIAVVALLIVVAIAGIVLATRNASKDPAATASPSASTPQAGSAPTAAVQAASGPPDPPPSEIVFAALSDKLPPRASDGLARFSDLVRSGGNNVRLIARFLTGEHKARDFELAKARTATIRHALQANGIRADQLQVELIEMPAGALKAGDADRVELALR